MGWWWKGTRGKGKGKRAGISYYSCFLQRVEVKCNNGARSFLLCLLGRGQGSIGGRFSDSGQKIFLGWPAWTACIRTRGSGQAFHTSSPSILHSWKGPSLNRNVAGFVRSYLLICSWRLSFLLQVLSFPSLFVY